MRLRVFKVTEYSASHELSHLVIHTLLGNDEYLEREATHGYMQDRCVDEIDIYGSKVVHAKVEKFFTYVA